MTVEEVTYRCDECKRTELIGSEMGKFHDGLCGICRRCLVRMNGPEVKPSRGTNRTPPKPKRRKRAKR